MPDRFPELWMTVQACLRWAWLRCHEAQALRRRYSSGARGGASSWSPSCSRHAWNCQGTGYHLVQSMYVGTSFATDLLHGSP